MIKITTTSLIALVLFVLGMLTYYKFSSLFKGKQYVTGVVHFHKANHTISGEPPEGYYVESSAIGRIYLKHTNIADFINYEVSMSGFLSEICGNDEGSCFPLIESDSTINKLD